jgi:hypothetical protein
MTSKIATPLKSISSKFLHGNVGLQQLDPQSNMNFLLATTRTLVRSDLQWANNSSLILEN